MEITTKEHTIIVTDSNLNVNTLLEKVTASYAELKDKNLIVDLSSFKTITIADVKTFLPLIKKYTKAKKSLVIVVEDLDFNDVPDGINAVPTLQEAHDIIEMEEIERDLGF